MMSPKQDCSALTFLPDEILYKIFSIVAPADIGTLSRTCRRLLRVCNCLPWCDMYVARWGHPGLAAMAHSPKTWRSLYSERIRYGKRLPTAMRVCADRMMGDDARPWLLGSTAQVGAVVAEVEAYATRLVRLPGVRFCGGAVATLAAQSLDVSTSHSIAALEAILPTESQPPGTEPDTSPDPSLASVPVIIKSLLRLAAVRTLEAECDKPTPLQQPETAALALEAYFHGELRSRPDFVDKLDVLAQQMRPMLIDPGRDPTAPTYDSSDRLAKLGRLVAAFRKLGFNGNREDYYNPNNSFLTNVLATKTGIPITLSVLLIGVARRLSFTLAPVNFPRHFILRCEIAGADEECFIDAFSGNMWSSRSATALAILGNNGPKMLAQGSNWFAPTDTRQIVLRMCRNLLNMDEGAPPGAITSIAVEDGYALRELAVRLQRI